MKNDRTFNQTVNHLSDLFLIITHYKCIRITIQNRMVELYNMYLVPTQ